MVNEDIGVIMVTYHCNGHIYIGTYHRPLARATINHPLAIELGLYFLLQQLLVNKVPWLQYLSHKQLSLPVGNGNSTEINSWC